MEHLAKLGQVHSAQGNGRSQSPFPLSFQNILGQTEEGSSRQENAQKALGAVSKVGRMEAEEGRCQVIEGKWKGAGGGWLGWVTRFPSPDH